MRAATACAAFERARSSHAATACTCSTAGHRHRSSAASTTPRWCRRSEADRWPTPDALRAGGRRLKVMELQGPLHFGSAESFSRAFAAESADASHLVLDLSRVTSVDPGAVPVLTATVRGVEGRVTVVIAGQVVDSLAVADVATYRSLDIALERCEDEILELLGVTAGGRFIHAGRSRAPTGSRARRAGAGRRRDNDRAVRCGISSLRRR